MEISANEFSEYLIDGNDALEFKLVRSHEDLEDDDTSFKPEMCHQIFGESEKIFGYSDLKIKLYYTAGRLLTYLGVEYSKKVDASLGDGVEADDIMGALVPKLAPGFMTNLDVFQKALEKDRTFKPYGELVHSFKAGREDEELSTFETYVCDSSDPEFIKFHSRLQTFLLWYVDAASFIDTDDNKWKYFVTYEAYDCDGEQRYAVAGYSTVFEYYAYPESIRPRISQMLVLPPFQRMGIGASMLKTIYNHYKGRKEVKDITVEDPAWEFQQMRNYVDATLCQKLSSFAPSKLHQGFSKEMAAEANDEWKINEKQARKVYEILRLKNTNVSDKEQYRQYRLDVKKRLNHPFQKEKSTSQKLQNVLTPDELAAAQALSNLEQRLETLEKLYRDVEKDYDEVIEKLAKS